MKYTIGSPDLNTGTTLTIGMIVSDLKDSLIMYVTVRGSMSYSIHDL